MTASTKAGLIWSSICVAITCFCVWAAANSGGATWVSAGVAAAATIVSVFTTGFRIGRGL